MPKDTDRMTNSDIFYGVVLVASGVKRVDQQSRPHTNRLSPPTARVAFNAPNTTGNRDSVRGRGGGISFVMRSLLHVLL